MYEYGFRLLRYNSQQALEKQVKCYLAALNALALCDRKDAWILRPTPPDADPQVICIPMQDDNGIETKVTFCLVGIFGNVVNRLVV